jgi:nitroreductase
VKRFLHRFLNYRHDIQLIAHIKNLIMTAEKQEPSENRLKDNVLWKLKVRLQFSGWLQYIIHAVLVLIMLMEAVHLNSQPNRQIGQQPIRFEYVAVPLMVWPVVGAHEFLVAIAPSEYNRLSVIDIGRSLQKIVTHATSMGIATCWIGPGADQKGIIQYLGNKFDPTRDHVICVCAVGYESMFKPLAIRLIQKLQHKRLPLSDLFFADPSFKAPLDTESEPFSDYGRCYEVCQWSPSSFNGQTTRCAAVTERVGDQDKLLRFNFYAATMSRYYAAVALGIWCANWEAGCAALNKNGHFRILLPEKRGSEECSDLPCYDVSWVVD